MLESTIDTNQKERKNKFLFFKPLYLKISVTYSQIYFTMNIPAIFFCFFCFEVFISLYFMDINY